MHRAQSIVEAIAASLEAASLQAKVFAHGVMTLDDEDQELPAVDVSMGSDQPFDVSGITNLSFIDSLLDIKISLYAKASSKLELTTELMRLRSATHQVLLAGDRAQGLAYVMDTRYGGAAELRSSTEGSRVTGLLETAYAVHYRMSVTTPE